MIENIFKILPAFLFFGFYILLLPLNAQEISEYELGNIFVQNKIALHGECKSPKIRNRVETIAEKILAVADRRGDISFTFVVLNMEEIGAYALPGGFIVLTKGIINTCRSDGELAFLLGHEIAHQIKGHVDSTLTESLRSRYRDQILSIGADGLGLVNDLCKEIKKEYEREADRLGVLYCMLAGYDVAGSLSVFDRIITTDTTGGSHPQVAERITLVKNKFSQIARSSEIFYLALALYHLQRYDESIRLFKTCQNRFPSKIIYHNIGTAYLARAIAGEAPVDAGMVQKTLSNKEDSFRPDWLLPGAMLGYNVSAYRRIDALERPRGRGGQENLLQAQRWFKKSLQRDPCYAPSQANMAYVLLKRGLYEKALLFLDKALIDNPSDPLLLNNKGVALFAVGDYKASTTAFQRAAAWNGSLPDGLFAAPHFNLAVLSMLTGNYRRGLEAFCKYVSVNSHSKGQWRHETALEFAQKAKNCSCRPSKKSFYILKEESDLLKEFKPGFSPRESPDILYGRTVGALAIGTVEKDDTRFTMLLAKGKIIAVTLSDPSTIDKMINLKSSIELLHDSVHYKFSQGMKVVQEQGAIIYGANGRINRLVLFQK